MLFYWIRQEYDPWILFHFLDTLPFPPSISTPEFPNATFTGEIQWSFPYDPLHHICIVLLPPVFQLLQDVLMCNQPCLTYRQLHQRFNKTHYNEDITMLTDNWCRLTESPYSSLDPGFQDIINHIRNQDIPAPMFNLLPSRTP